ncbi:universal stress protein [Streptomyces prasinosporus]|uniref:Universal stress protein n=1 Tax=Streptomyces prasinosporus TaxID=68256 RepID=A0ABP6TI20_9ACTN
MLPPVIAGVDGSAESLAAAEWAAHEARRRERPLRLVHARPWHPRGEDEPEEAVRLRLARRVLRQARERVRSVRPDVRVDDEQVEGPAAAGLLNAAEQAELLVLGSRGLSGLTGILAGSVALEVVTRATRPVVLVRAGEDTQDEHPPADGAGPPLRTGHRDVVLGVDVGDPCDEVIEFAFGAADLRHTRLRAVHTWRAPSPLGFGPGEIGLVAEPQRREEWRSFLTAVLQPWREKYPEVEVQETVTEGRAQSALLRAATGASLLVVGRHITGNPLGPRTGPVAHAVVRHADCPVAVVPHG